MILTTVCELKDCSVSKTMHNINEVSPLRVNNAIADNLEYLQNQTDQLSSLFSNKGTYMASPYRGTGGRGKYLFRISCDAPYFRRCSDEICYYLKT